MTEITPFPENNYETVLLDRPFGRPFCTEKWEVEPFSGGFQEQNIQNEPKKL